MRLLQAAALRQWAIEAGGPGSGRRPGFGNPNDTVLRFHIKKAGETEDESGKKYNTWHYELHERPIAEQMVNIARNSGFEPTLEEIPRSQIEGPWDQSGNVDQTRARYSPALRPLAARREDYPLLRPPSSRI